VKDIVTCRKSWLRLEKTMKPNQFSYRSAKSSDASQFHGRRVLASGLVTSEDLAIVGFRWPARCRAGFDERLHSRANREWHVGSGCFHLRNHRSLIRFPRLGRALAPVDVIESLKARGPQRPEILRDRYQFLQQERASGLSFCQVKPLFLSPGFRGRQQNRHSVALKGALDQLGRTTR